MNTMKINYNLSIISFKPSDISSIKELYTAIQTSPVKPKYLGCYMDNDNNSGNTGSSVWNRAIPERLSRHVDTVEECANLTKRALWNPKTERVTMIENNQDKTYNINFNIFGLQHGGECWAGSGTNYSKFGKSPEDCGVLGNAWRNQVYKLDNQSVMNINISNVNNDIVSNINSSTYNIMTNSSFTPIISKINSILLKITNFTQFITHFNKNIIDYFPLQIYKPIAPDNYTSLGHIFCNTPTDLKKIIDSKNVACIPSQCVKEMRDWTINDKIYEYNQKNTYFAIYFNPYTGTFISTNNNAQQLPDGKVCKVVACVAKCTAIDDLQKADDCSRKYYNLNKQAVTSTPLTSTLVSSQEEEFYLDKIQNQSDSITRLRQRAQKMQTDTDKAIIVNREMNQNKLQDYVDLQKQNIDIIMKRLQADKNKIQTNINIPADTLKSLIQMIKESSLLNSEQKTNLLTKIASSQNLPNSQYNVNLNEVLKSCPQFDLTVLVSKKTVSDVCYGCDIPK